MRGTKDDKQTTPLLIKEYNKDTVSHFYLLPEIGRAHYFQRDYKTAYQYYKKIIAITQARQLDIIKTEALRIAIVMAKLGMKEKSEEYIKSFVAFADHDKSIYKNLNWMGYYAWKGDRQKAMDYMKLFSEEDNFQYWILFLANDPVFDEIKKLPEFTQLMAAIEKKFWGNHKKIRVMLEEKGLL